MILYVLGSFNLHQVFYRSFQRFYLSGFSKLFRVVYIPCVFLLPLFGLSGFLLLTRLCRCHALRFCRGLFRLSSVLPDSRAQVPAG